MADLLMVLGMMAVGGAWSWARISGRRSFRFPWECSHPRVTFPQRTQGVDVASCLECGESLDYQKLTRCEWINR